MYALAIDPELALLDYLQMFYKLGSAGRALKKLGAIDFATTIAPGLRDVLLTGKACEAVRRKDKSGRFAYDYVVMDAPPTGRITRFLNVNDEVAGLAKIGPIHNQAQAVMRVLKSPETAVHLVTLLEEMPVQETADGIAELRAAEAAGGRGHREHGPARAARRRRRWHSPAAAPRRRSPRRCRGRARRRAARRARRAAGRPAAGAGRGARRAGTRWSASSGPCWPSWACRCTNSRCSARAWTWRASTELADGAAEAGDVMSPDPATAPDARMACAHARVLEIDPLLDDPKTRIVVCCGSGGVGKTTTAAALGRAGRRARPQGGRAHHRPGAPARPVHGHRLARQHPAPGEGRRRAAANCTP